MFILDKLSRQPIYEQMIDQVEKMILQGVLKPGDPLPSVRQLSMEISVNPNTLQKAYAELDRRGICFSSPGNGRFVSEDAETAIQNSRRQGLNQLEALVGELAMAGIDKDTVMDVVVRAYNNQTRGKDGVSHD
ncbi:MAG: GntR family transcriptional regulator [Clostridia bacterium]|nr:GntR family transcriptional regulator [Clostridia bacterium]